MTSKNAKRAAAVVATLTTSLMFGAAFAAPPSGAAGRAGDTTTVVDHPIGGPYAVVVDAITDARLVGQSDTSARTADDNPLGVPGEVYALIVNAITGTGQAR